MSFQLFQLGFVLEVRNRESEQKPLNRRHRCVPVLAEKTARLLSYSSSEMMHVSSYFKSRRTLSKVRVEGWLRAIRGRPLNHEAQSDVLLIKNPFELLYLPKR